MKILLFLFLTLLCAHAEERILSFDSEIRVGRDGFLDVVETMRVNVERDQINHGIYRDFPQEYETKWGLNQYRPFEVTGVMRNGIPEPYALEKMGSGTRVRIGSVDEFLENGSVQEYIISYRTGNQLWFDEEGDELYWNVTGNFWDFPILEAKARVYLPEGIALQEAEAYTGSMGAEGRNYEKTEESDGVSFQTTTPLGRNEGLTVVVRWELGKLDAVAYEEPSIWKGNEVLFLGLILLGMGFGVFAVFWFKAGRDPSRGLIVPGWEPPEDFSPAAARYLKKMGFDNRCFTAAVLSLAAKSFLKIEEHGVSSYKLLKQDGKEALTPDEEVLYESLFSDEESLLLDQSNHIRIGGAKAKLKSALRKRIRGVYFHNHTKQWLIALLVCVGGLITMTLSTVEPVGIIMMMVFTMFVAIGIGVVVVTMCQEGASKLWILLLLPLLGFLALMLVVIDQVGGVWCAVATPVVLLAGPTFHFLMKAPTPAGRKALDTIAGFREYLELAEEDRLNLENPPERTPELFERFLPYALALGVEQNWSEKFDDVLSATGEAQGDQSYTPTFYTGGRSGFENALTGAGIGAAIGGALASSSVAPSSSGSSSGRSSSGGFSGGGGGGGGGGGW